MAIRGLVGGYGRANPSNQRARHADKLMEQAAKAYAAHFAPLGIEPQGESPVVAQLREWKKQLAARRGTVELALAGNLTCVNCPTAILPYTVEGTATEGGLL